MKKYTTTKKAAPKKMMNGGKPSTSKKTAAPKKMMNGGKASTMKKTAPKKMQQGGGTDTLSGSKLDALIEKLLKMRSNEKNMKSIDPGFYKEVDESIDPGFYRKVDKSIDPGFDMGSRIINSPTPGQRRMMDKARPIPLKNGGKIKNKAK